MDLRVRDKRTGVIRTVTHFAYAAMGPKVYEKLGDEPVKQPQVHRTVSGPVIKPQITAEKSQEEADQQKAETGTSAPAESVQKKRPGRPAREKSISSNSTSDEK